MNGPECFPRLLLHRGVGRPPLLSAGEWGLLAAALIIAISIVAPAVQAWREHRRVASARSDLRAIERALARYARDHGRWPTPATAAGEDARFGARRANAELMRALLGQSHIAEGAPATNPRKKTAYLAIPVRTHGRSGLDARGEFVDPWGEPYQIALDTDYDNVIVLKDAPFLELPDRQIAIWSKGPDRVSGTRDDIRSWP